MRVAAGLPRFAKELTRCNMYKKQQPRKGEFRLIRVFTLKHNLTRFKKHVAKLVRRMRGDRFIKIMRLKNTRRRRYGA